MAPSEFDVDASESNSDLAECDVVGSDSYVDGSESNVDPSDCDSERSTSHSACCDSLSGGRIDPAASPQIEAAGGEARGENC